MGFFIYIYGRLRPFRLVLLFLLFILDPDNEFFGPPERFIPLPPLVKVAIRMCSNAFATEKCRAQPSLSNLCPHKVPALCVALSQGRTTIAHASRDDDDDGVRDDDAARRYANRQSG